MLIDIINYATPSLSASEDEMKLESSQGCFLSNHRELENATEELLLNVVAATTNISFYACHEVSFKNCFFNNC